MTSSRDHAALLVPNAARSGLARDVVAGAVASLLPISNCFSYAALLFSGLWARFLGEGVAVLLISGAVISLTVAITSSFRVVVAGPIAATSALFAAMLVRLAQPVAGQTDAVALATAYELDVSALASAPASLPGWPGGVMLHRTLPRQRLRLSTGVLDPITGSWGFATDTRQRKRDCAAWISMRMSPQ